MTVELASEARPPRQPANVVLIGLSGSGKTTVARLAARRLGWRFLDTDHEIQRRTGLTVQRIFRDQGEPAFRALEREAVRAACSGHRTVIATGGGAVLDQDNLAVMLAKNLVVFLETPPETLAERLAPSLAREPRPLLEADLIGRLIQLRREREHRYRQAHHVVRTERRTPQAVAEAVVELVRVR